MRVIGDQSSPIGKQTIIAPASAWKPEVGASGPTLSDYEGSNLDIAELLFDGASTETAFLTFQAPNGADETAALVFEVSYQPKGTSSGNVRWSVSAVAVGDGDTTDATLGTAVADDSAAGATANVTQRSGEMSVTVGGSWATGDDIHVKLQRLGGHANDTNTDDVGLINVRIHYTIVSGNDS
jgi:hypothetical protein